MVGWAPLNGWLGKLVWGSGPAGGQHSGRRTLLGIWVSLYGWLGTSKKNPGLNGTFVMEHKEGKPKALPAAVAVWRRSPHRRPPKVFSTGDERVRLWVLSRVTSLPKV